MNDSTPPKAPAPSPSGAAIAGALLATGLAVTSFITALGVGSILGLVGAVVALVTWRMGPGWTRTLAGIAGALGLLVALAIFTVRIAAPNIISGGIRASERVAVSSLRTVMAAQDEAIKHYGEPVLMAALTGKAGHKDQAAMPTPPLAPRFYKVMPGPDGPVTDLGAYLLVVYVQGQGKVPAPEAGQSPRWLAYTWPARVGESGLKAYCINSAEDIFETANTAEGQKYEGPGRPPAFDACLSAGVTFGDRLVEGSGQDGGQWVRWRGKKTRRAKRADQAP